MNPSGHLTTDDYIAGIRSGDRGIMGRAITLIESRAPHHRRETDALISALLPFSGTALRMGISGIPGVGKSTLIETFGTLLTGRGLKVAVLAIDPTSSRSGGSILGDKTRMEKLAADPLSFIRPSPTSGHLGGVARTTRESVIVCEAAGYDVVLIETVGTGQSETCVADMVDVFLLLILPNAGDELQGIKRGILELADIVAVNKVDNQDDPAARQTCQDYRCALNIVGRTTPSGWKTPVLPISALRNQGLETLWDTIQAYHTLQKSSGTLEARRQQQKHAWMWSLVQDRLDTLFREHPDVRRRLPGIEADISRGVLDPSKAAEELLAAFIA
ncbi:methylmalonyl Co-A mutase-associated GTPase MeaB [Haematospirillum sp. H1815]|uniref:methylmalonyl Co-A mutase-associated GTPase MeaB n=1 Tax=Haematospirillum sp. H1815 TaxID=2723108 RepID=UPI001ADE7F3C|nr:methylmalonyl Co-A mutase-associated GTPase MeaB [Haematospirillum sp. H1815]